MARSPLIPAALLAAMGAALALPVLAQDAPPPGPAKPRAAEIRLDFGAGRKVAISCGDTAIEACLAASGAVIDKVATSAPVFPPHRPEGGPEGRGKHGDGKHGEGKHGPKGGPKGGPDAPPAE